jgi:xanthine dehydrogenase accessory factor
MLGVFYSAGGMILKYGYRFLIPMPHALCPMLYDSATKNSKKGTIAIKLSELVIAIKGAGEMASAVAWRLYMANLRRIFMLESDRPLAVRRAVSFCEAVYDGKKEVEGVKALFAPTSDEIKKYWADDKIAVVADPHWRILEKLKADVVVDAILAKKNLGTNLNEAELVIGLGPGFSAGKDVHWVIETNRGHNLGRIITSGAAEPNTGIPGSIGGFAEERVLRAPGVGKFVAQKKIGDYVRQGDIIGRVDKSEVEARIDGVLRGLIRTESRVRQGLKIGDIDPRGEVNYCTTISDKARAISGSVLEAILRVYNAEGGMRNAEIRRPDTREGAVG